MDTELIQINTQELIKIEQAETKKQAKQLAKDTHELQLIMSDLNELLINQTEVLEDTNETVSLVYLR